MNRQNANKTILVCFSLLLWMFWLKSIKYDESHDKRQIKSNQIKSPLNGAFKSTNYTHKWNALVKTVKFFMIDSVWPSPFSYCVAFFPLTRHSIKWNTSWNRLPIFTAFSTCDSNIYYLRYLQWIMDKWKAVGANVFKPYFRKIIH